MAIQALTNAYFALNGTSYSANVRRISLTDEVGTVDVTAMGATTRANMKSLKNWSLEVEFNQDFAASALDSVISPLMALTAAEVSVEIRGNNATVTTSNPKWTATSAIITNYNPVSGSVGDPATVSITIIPGSVAANNTLTRATS